MPKISRKAIPRSSDALVRISGPIRYSRFLAPHISPTEDKERLAGLALLKLSSKSTIDTPTSLWSGSALLASDYKPGIEIADHLEIIENSNGTIVIRGGEKVPNQGLRPLDAFLELTARVDETNDTVEFGFKSIFFQGLGKSDKLPMPGPVIWLHEQYAKALVEFGVRYVLK